MQELVEKACDHMVKHREACYATTPEPTTGKENASTDGMEKQPRKEEQTP